jgi:hypothetical protein
MHTYRGKIIIPNTADDAYNLLAHWKHDPRNMIKVSNNGGDGVVFNPEGTTKGDETGTNLTNVGKKNKNRTKDHIMCFNCGKKGHYSSPEFPDKEGKDLGTDNTKAVSIASAELPSG